MTTLASWDAVWVEPHEAEAREVQRPAYHLAGTTHLDSVPRSARLRITAHGIYEAFVNGVRVSDEELRPGYTSYRTRLQVQRYDVASLLHPGENVLGILLSDGWWRGQYSGPNARYGRWHDSYGTTVGVLAEIDADDTVVLATDEHWRSTPSHILAADLMAGEVHDLRRRVIGWSEPGTDRSAWDRVHVVDPGFDALCETVGPPVRRIEELPAESVREVAPGRHLVDFGQNSNGWVRLRDLGPAGTELTLVHAEALTPDGDDVTTEALSGIRSGGKMLEPAFARFQTDVVISAGDGTTFEPRHSTKGFRYVRVDGHPGPLDASSITSVVVHTDLPRVGAFTCSDERLNRLHTAAEWAFRTNACELPTDCPTRERAGWSGDWQVFVETAAYLFDVTDFSAKWLLDVAAEQLANGAVTNIVPDPTEFAEVAPDHLWLQFQGSAGWGDAGVHVPWELYRSTGKVELLERQLDSMRRWVDFAAARAANERHPDRVATRPTPAAHERFIWDAPFHFGEWGEPGVGIGDFGAFMRADQGVTATAFLHRSATELASALAVVGDDASAKRYRELAAHVRAAWQAEYVDADGHVQPATQPNLVRALAFDLLTVDLATVAAADLAELVRGNGSHVGTGFLATPYLLPVLADIGHLDIAYDVLLQDTPPSWLAMLGRGATTIWEGWDALRTDGTQVASLNHYSMGAVISFLHRYVAGLQIVEPGYRRFRVAPRPGGGITSARTHHDAPSGRIEVSWEIHDRQGVLDVTVPPGTEAELAVPGGEPEVIGPGTHQRAWTRDLAGQAG